MKRYLGVYSVIVLIPVALAVGMVMWATHGVGGGTAAVDAGGQTASQLLLAAAVVVVAAAVGGAVARRCGQPGVVGELAAGLILGPSVLGALAPQVSASLLPASVLPQLDTLAQFGVVFFMFLIGAELPAGTLRRSASAGFVIGHASIAVPFLIGTGVAWWLYGQFPPPHASLMVYVLFVAVSFAITAFPVLARILSEQRLLHTPLGVTGMAAAGIGDVTAWGLLAVLIALTRGTSLLAAGAALVFVTLFAVIMFWVVKPSVAWVLERAEAGRASRNGVCAALVCLVLVSALITDRIGVHAIFGAFLAGVIMPRDSSLVEELVSRIHGVTVWFLLPLFFATVGLRTELGSLTGVGTWLTCLLIVVVAVVAKVASGAVATAAVGGHTRRETLAIGVMMNCRGLTELVVLSLGVQLGVLNHELFAMFVVMALLTTAMTGPILRRLIPAHVPPQSHGDEPRSRTKEEHHDSHSA